MALFTATPFLFVKDGENAPTPASPVRRWRNEDEPLLKVMATYCASFDFDMPVECHKYERHDVVLPSWLTPEEWLGALVDWKYVWGMGADPRWPEAWQRGLKRIGGSVERATACALLGAKLKSEFRMKLRDQILAWIETPPEERKYASPLSHKQWDAATNVHAARAATNKAEGLYRDRSYLGLARCSVHPSCLADLDTAVSCAYGCPKVGALPVPAASAAEVLAKIEQAPMPARPDF